MKQKELKNQEPKREIYYVVKLSSLEYVLKRLEIEGSEVVSDTVVHKDIPNIVYGKLVQKMRAMGVSK